MTFSKRFPKKSKTSVYPQWEDTYLADEEEKGVEEKARQENINIMDECLADAEKIIRDNGLERSDVAKLAIALFEKRASHTIWWKERKAKEKFDASN